MVADTMVGGPPDELTAAGGGAFGPVALGFIAEATGEAVAPPYG